MKKQAIATLIISCIMIISALIGYVYIEPVHVHDRSSAPSDSIADTGSPPDGLVMAGIQTPGMDGGTASAPTPSPTPSPSPTPTPEPTAIPIERAVSPTPLPTPDPHLIHGTSDRETLAEVLSSATAEIAEQAARVNYRIVNGTSNGVISHIDYYDSHDILQLKELYNDNGSLYGIEVYNERGDLIYSNSSAAVTSYRNDGRLNSYIRYACTPESGLSDLADPVMYVNCVYDSHDNLSYERHLYPTGDGSLTLDVIIYCYDGANRVTGITTHRSIHATYAEAIASDGEDGMIISDILYSYDKFGRLISDGVYEYEYDTSDRVIKKTDIAHPEFYTTYKFSKYDLMTSSTEYLGEKKTRTTKYTYDSKNRVSTTIATTTDKKAGTKQVITTAYSYKLTGQTIHKSWQVTDSEGNIIEEGYTTTEDHKGYTFSIG